MANEFLGKVVLVTGSSSGIGAATAIHFAKSGAHVVITGRKTESLQSIYDQCKAASEQGKFNLTNPVVHLAGDITDDEFCKKLVDTTIENYGKLDILVNNAGASYWSSIHDPEYMMTYKRLMDVNLRSVVQLTHIAVPYLEKTKGVIVNVSSIASTKPVNVCSVYAMSKAALDMFTKCLALELGPKGVRVNTVNPGVVKTNIELNMGLSQETVDQGHEGLSKIIPMRRIGQPEEIAKNIAFLASDNTSYITGTGLLIDGGATWTIPSVYEY